MELPSKVSNRESFHAYQPIGPVPSENPISAILNTAVTINTANTMQSSVIRFLSAVNFSGDGNKTKIAFSFTAPPKISQSAIRYL